MSRTRPSKIYREVKQVLEDCGRPYDIVCGTKHNRVMIDGVQVAVFSIMDNGRGVDALEIIAAIRRHCRRTNR